MPETHEVLLPEIAKGIHAGALEAIRKARLYGTKLVVWRNGEVVELTADEAEAELREREQMKGKTLT